MKVRFPVLMLSAIAAISFADGGGSSAGLKRGSATAFGVRTNAAERGLVGIALYDPGVKVIRLFGEPDEIQSIGGTGTGVAGGGGGGGARPGGAPGPVRGGGGGGVSGAGAPIAGSHRDFSFGDQFLNGSLNVQDDDPVGRGTMGPPRGGQGNAPAAAGLGGSGGGGAAAGTGTNANRILYTRWIYRMGPSRYGFIFDRSNLVVQIEALGTSDRRVYTNRGIRFGSTFGDIIKRYGAPDAYEINGPNLVVRYLVRNNVAFRLNHLDPKKPYVVTGIVVAAGKQ